MGAVKRPAIVAEETYRWCISRVPNNGLKRRLEDIAEHIAEATAREISSQRTNMIRIFDARGDIGVREELRKKSSTWEEYSTNC